MVLLGFGRFYWVLLSFIEQFIHQFGLETKLNRIFLDLTKFYEVSSGFNLLDQVVKLDSVLFNGNRFGPNVLKV